MTKTLFIVLALALLALPAAAARNHPGVIRGLAVSPDSKLMAVEFAKDKNSFIYLVDPATGVARRLTDATEGGEYSPAFSPDGKRIAYFYDPEMGMPSKANVPGIVIVNIDGTDRHAWPLGTNCLSPVFSPDNKMLVYSCYGFYGNYSPIAQPHPHAWDFFEADLDGTNVRQLTNETFYMASTVSISHDGKDMVAVTEGLETNRQMRIYSLDQPPHVIRSLQPHVPKEADHKSPTVDFPNYMPDGKSILFMAASNGKHGYDYDVYRVDLETNSIERLTVGNSYATSLTVSADGKTAAFLKWRSDWHATPVQSELYLLDVQSRQLTPVQIKGLD